jgi:hypothetical protein
MPWLSGDAARQVARIGARSKTIRLYLIKDE